MEHVAIFDVIRRHLVMIIVLCVAAGAAGYGFSLLMPNRFEALSLLLVRPQQPIKMGGNTGGKEFLDFPMASASTVETASKTYIEIIKSPALISDVVSELGLEKDQEEAADGKLSRLLPAPLKGLGKSLKNLVTLFKYGKLIQDDPYTKAVKDVSGGLSLEATLDTYIFQLKYTGGDPKKAANIANTTAKTLIRFVDGMRVTETQQQVGSLKTELDQAENRVNRARQRLEDYKKAHATYQPDKEYETKLKLIGDLEFELAKVDESLVGSRNTLSSVSLAARRGRLIKLIEERRAELATLPGIERDLKQLDQDVKNSVNAYEIVEKDYKEAQIKQSYATPEVSLISAAVAPNLPVAPQRGLIAAVSLMGGLVVAVGLAFLLESLNRGIRGIEDIEDFVGVKVIGTIPRVPLRRWQHGALL